VPWPTKKPPTAKRKRSRPMFMDPSIDEIAMRLCAQQIGIGVTQAQVPRVGAAI
jgi:hypothetical protein